MGPPTAEMQHKMSKKIAQLTKVIYHLNTRNEDNETTIKAMTEQHEKEVHELLQDASTKIRKFKEELDKQKEAGVSSEVLEAMQKQYEEEKTTLQKELNVFKNKATAKEEQQKAEFKSRVKALQRELDEARSEFQSQKEDLESRASKLEKDLENGDKGTEKLKRTLKKELSDAREEAEQKYNALFSEKAAIEEQLRSEIGKITLAHQKELSELRANQNDELERVQEQLSVERFRAIQTLKDSGKEELEKVNEHFETTIRKLREELMRARESKEELENKLVQVEADLLDTRQKFHDLKTAITSEQNARKSVEGNAKLASEQVSALERKLAEQSKLSSTRQKELQSEVDRLSSEVKGMEEANQKMRDKLADQLRKNATLEAKGEVRDTEIAEQQLTNAKLSSKVQSLEHELEQTKSNGANASNIASQSITELQEKLLIANNSIKALEKQLQVLDEESTRERESLSKSAESQVSKMKNDLENQIELIERDYREKMGSMKVMYDEENNQLRKDLEELKKDHKKKLENFDREQSKTILELQAKVSTLEAEQIEIESNKATQALENDALKLELEKAKSAVLHAETEHEHLRKQLLETKCELDQSYKNFNEELEAASKQAEKILLETVAEWEAKLRKAQETFKQERSQTVMDMEKRLGQAMSEIEQTGSKKVSELQQRVIQAELQLREESQAKRELEIQLGTKLDESRSSFLKQLEEKRADTERALEHLSFAHKNELIRVKEEHQQTLAETISRGIEERNALTNQLREQSNLTIEKLRIDLGQQKSSELAQIRKQLNSEFENTRSMLLRENQQALDDQKERLTSENEALVASMLRKHKEVVDEFQSKVKQLEKKLESLEAAKANLEQLLEGAKENHSQDIQRFTLEREMLHDDHRKRCNDLETRHSRSAQQMMDKHQEEVSMMQQKYNNLEIELQSEKRQLEKTVKFWEHKYEHREPRPEDVRQIGKLSKKLENALEKAKKSSEEMQFYKMELVNREQSYNRVFGRAPNVGVMQVIKQPTVGNARAEDDLQAAASRFALEKREKKEKKKKDKKDKKRKDQNLEFPPLNNTRENQEMMHWATPGPARDFDDDQDEEETRSVTLERPKHQASVQFSRRLTME